MNNNYIFSTIFVTMSCSTVALGIDYNNNEFICPDQSVEIPKVEPSQYLLSKTEPSFISTPMSTSSDSEFQEFEVLTSFGKKYFENETKIDETIQKVINENFWDML